MLSSYSEYTKPWDEVSEQEKTELLKDLRLSGYDPDIPATIFKQKQPSFYPGYILLQAKIELSGGQREGKVFIWKKQSEFIQLNWGSLPIHEANAKGALRLSKDTAADYLRFFCDFVCSDAGPFTIIENGNHPRFQGKYQEDIDKVKIKPLKIKASGDKFTTDAYVWYGTQLFEAKLSVGADGMVEMLDDTPVLELPSTGMTLWHLSQTAPG